MGGVKLALQRWNAGQVLEPEHFRAQEEALLGAIGLTDRLHGLPAYGVARLAWNAEALASQGLIAISSMTAVFPGGALIDVPRNASITSLDLTKVGAAKVTVYLHLVERTHDARDLDLYEDDPDCVERVIHEVQLSVSPVPEGQDQLTTSAELSWESSRLKLAEVQKRADGIWVVARTYVPPLLQLGASPFLQERLDELDRLLTNLQRQLGQQLLDTFFRGEQMATARRCGLQAFRLRALLFEQRGRVNRHPYFLFDALRSFYLDLCALHNAEPGLEPSALVYEHDRIAICFDELVQRIRDKTGSEPARSPSVPFVRRDDGRFVASPFTPELIDADEVYLVVQRVNAAKPVSLVDVKLASPDHLEETHMLARGGVHFSDASPPGFAHTFGASVDFHRLDLGEEWKHARSARALAYYAIPAVEQVKTTLYGRKR